MKKFFALILALIMCFSLVACGGGSDDAATDGGDAAVETKVLKVAVNRAITNPEGQTLQWISDELEARTEGRYKLEISPDAQLGDQAQTLKQVTMGVLDMSLVANSVIETYASDFAILGTPYVYDSIEHQQRVFESGKLEPLYDTTKAHGFTVLCTYSLGARNLYTRDGAVAAPTDLAGMKIRVMLSDSCFAAMKAMGGISIAMAQGDVYSAIQSGILDGAENDIITYTELALYKVAPYYNLSGHLMIPDHLVIANGVLEAMSAEDQAILKEICAESIPYCFQKCADLRADYQGVAEENGVTFTECDVPAFQALCADLINDVANRSDMTKAAYEAIVSER